MRFFTQNVYCLFVCARAMAGWKDGGPRTAAVGGRASAHGTVSL